MKKWLPIIARVLLGLLFFASGLAYLLGYAKPPDDLPEAVKVFNAGMDATGYFMKLLKTTEVICGLLLISGFFVPLALVILAPISLNIFLVHLFILPQGVPVAVVIGLLMIFLSFFSPYSYPIRALFRPK